MKKITLLTALALALSCSAASAQVTEMKSDVSEIKDPKFVTVEEAAKTALKVGAVMPTFTLNDPLGKIVKSSHLLKTGNLVVVFYRGAWCPFCNKYLHILQQNLTQIRAKGGDLVAISVEPADRSMAVSKKNELLFTVLSDRDLTVARKFGIVYQLPPELDEKYKSVGIDLVKNNSTEKPELPISATYVVDKKGKIVFAHIEPDYKKRAEPAAIIEALAKIKK